MPIFAFFIISECILPTLGWSDFQKSTEMKGAFKETTMKIKTITAAAQTKFDELVNEFISNTSIEVIDIKYALPFFFHSACIIYKDLK